MSKATDAEVSPSSGASDTTSGWVTLVVGVVITFFLLWTNHPKMFGRTTAGLGFYEFNLTNLVGFFFIPLLITTLFLRRDPSDFGMVAGDVKRGALVAVILFACFVPVLLFFAPQAGPQRYYLAQLTDSGAITNYFWKATGLFGGKINLERLFWHEAVMAFYMFGWEWYHRGYLLNGLRKIMPDWAAILVQAIFFTILHLGKPPAEVVSSFPGGILMGYLSRRFGSFVPCFLLHFLVSAGFDAAVMYYHFR